MYLQEPIYKQLGSLVKISPETMTFPFVEKSHLTYKCYSNELHSCHNAGVLLSHCQLFQGKPQLCDEGQWQAYKFHGPDYYATQLLQARTPPDPISEEGCESCIW